MRSRHLFHLSTVHSRHPPQLHFLRISLSLYLFIIVFADCKANAYLASRSLRENGSRYLAARCGRSVSRIECIATTDFPLRREQTVSHVPVLPALTVTSSKVLSVAFSSQLELLIFCHWRSVCTIFSTSFKVVYFLYFLGTAGLTFRPNIEHSIYPSFQTPSSQAKKSPHETYPVKSIYQEKNLEEFGIFIPNQSGITISRFRSSKFRHRWCGLVYAMGGQISTALPIVAVQYGTTLSLTYSTLLLQSAFLNRKPSHRRILNAHKETEGRYNKRNIWMWVCREHWLGTYSALHIRRLYVFFLC